MLRLALTGNIAAGKSTVAALFHTWGATIIDADQLVREVQKAGSPTLLAMVARFGTEILKKNGSLNRAKLREIVLADSKARHDLEGIVHPAVAQLRDAKEAAAKKRGVKILVQDIPLLFEALDPGAFDRVILVDAPEALRLSRLMASRNLSDNQARALIAAQMPSEEKRKWVGGQPPRPVIIIDNVGTTAELEIAARRAWEEAVSR
ncbi:MAG TPA: dephospho-CoA kinase [Gemmatimonadales bacterium]|nr:dephospho-CoA kinase [Gemmatimonadales bacterium]